MAALLVGLKTVLYIMNRSKVYTDYLCSLPVALERTNFESALTDLHVIIFEFLTRAIQLYQVNTVTRSFDAIWKPEDVANFESECHSIEERVEIEATNCDRLLSGIEREAAARCRVDLQSVLNDLMELRNVKDSVEKVHMEISMLWNTSIEDKQAEILEWISKIPYIDNQRIASEGRTKDTGEWIFHHPQYQEWNTSHQSMILWLHGIRMFLSYL